jgi:hypothetical protein
MFAILFGERNAEIASGNRFGRRSGDLPILQINLGKHPRCDNDTGIGKGGDGTVGADILFDLIPTKLEKFRIKVRWKECFGKITEVHR